MIRHLRIQPVVNRTRGGIVVGNARALVGLVLMIVEAQGLDVFMDTDLACQLDT